MTIEAREKIELVFNEQPMGYYTRSELFQLHDMLAKLLRKPSPNMRPEQIIEEVCFHYAITVQEIKSNSRPNRIVWPRHVAMLLLREHGISLEEVSNYLDRINHGTVVNAIERVKAVIQTDRKKANELAELRAKLVCKTYDVAA